MSHVFKSCSLYSPFRDFISILNSYFFHLSEFEYEQVAFIVIRSDVWRHSISDECMIVDLSHILISFCFTYSVNEVIIDVAVNVVFCFICNYLMGTL